jgi:hypothetical protein
VPRRPGPGGVRLLDDVVDDRRVERRADRVRPGRPLAVFVRELCLRDRVAVERPGVDRLVVERRPLGEADRDEFDGDSQGHAGIALRPHSDRDAVVEFSGLEQQRVVVVVRGGVEAEPVGEQGFRHRDGERVVEVRQLQGREGARVVRIVDRRERQPVDVALLAVAPGERARFGDGRVLDGLRDVDDVAVVASVEQDEALLVCDRSDRVLGHRSCEAVSTLKRRAGVGGRT